MAKTFEVDVDRQWMRDWLGNEIVPGDLIVMPARQGSSGAEHILYKVEKFLPKSDNNYYNNPVVVAKALAHSRYGYTKAQRSSRLYVLDNVTRVDVARVDI